MSENAQKQREYRERLALLIERLELLDALLKWKAWGGGPCRWTYYKHKERLEPLTRMVDRLIEAEGGEEEIERMKRGLKERQADAIPPADGPLPGQAPF
jgi:hypothetical protein